MSSLLLIALLLPIPLTFSHILPPPLLILYEAAVVVQWFLDRSGRRVIIRSSHVNILAGLGLLLFIADIRYISYHLIQVADHLTLFLILIKVYSIRGSRDHGQFMVLSVFLFLSAMASSTHVSVLLYLLVMIPAFCSHLMTITQPGRILKRSVLPVTLVSSLLAAVPLFFLLPRLSRAYIRGLPQKQEVSSGLSDSITLGTITSFREDRTPVLRLTLPEGVEPDRALRLRAITYDYTDGIRWERRSVRVTDRDTLSLPPLAGGSRLTLFLHPRVYPHVPLPYGVVDLVIPERIHVYEDGIMMIGSRSSTPVAASVLIHRDAPLIRDVSGSERWLQLPLEGADYRAIADAILEGEVLSDGATCQALVHYFHSRFTYTDHPVLPVGSDPVEHFLTRSRAGHCELFATAMTLLLRSRGIPARVVGGFLGGDYNPIQKYYTVRQRNAHAWVEARISGRWLPFDPTPPSGQPPMIEGGGGLWRSIQDSFTFFWDRHILPFGKEEQSLMLLSLRRRLARVSLAPLNRRLPLLAVAAGLLLSCLLLIRFLSIRSVYRGLRRKISSLTGERASCMGPAEVRETLNSLLPGKVGWITRFMNGYMERSFGPSRVPRFGSALYGWMLWFSLRRAGRRGEDPPRSSPHPSGSRG